MNNQMDGIIIDGGYNTFGGLLVQGNHGDGVRTSGGYNFISKSKISGNAGDGVAFGEYSRIDGVTVAKSGRYGILMQVCCATITNGIVTGSTDDAIHLTGPFNVLLNNRVKNNNATGVRLYCPSTVRKLTATGNPTNLIENGGGCLNMSNDAP
jgi:hypothetical protein